MLKGISEDTTHLQRKFILDSEDVYEKCIILVHNEEPCIKIMNGHAGMPIYIHPDDLDDFIVILRRAAAAKEFIDNIGIKLDD